MPLNCMLKDGDSVHIHVKAMTEVFDALSSRKKIEYLLAYRSRIACLSKHWSTQDGTCYWEVEERKLKGKEESSAGNDRAMAMAASHKFKKKVLQLWKTRSHQEKPTQG